MSDYSDVLVFGEIAEGELSVSTLELLGGGREIADQLGEELLIVLIGSDIGALAQEAIASGADKVYVADDPQLRDYRTDSYLMVMESIILQVTPKIVIMGQTTIGRDLAPRLAFRLESAATMDCVALAIDPDSRRLLQTKPVYGGIALAVYTNDSDPQIATVRAKIMSSLEPDPSRKGEVVEVEVDLDPSAERTVVLEKIKEEIEGIKLEDAPVVISGGRGIGGAEGFKQLAELAKLMKGAVGASRPACDSGWMPDTSQIGLTGKIVAPNLYLAIGISGSSQHMTGCSGSKNIVAINKDPEANIFNEAHYGVVGDWKKILPVFTEKVKELLG
jgi:electron transfer flavoprotein alpha subunit